MFLNVPNGFLKKYERSTALGYCTVSEGWITNDKVKGWGRGSRGGKGDRGRWREMEGLKGWEMMDEGRLGIAKV